jgi:hypothetical protein
VFAGTAQKQLIALPVAKIGLIEINNIFHLG